MRGKSWNGYSISSMGTWREERKGMWADKRGGKEIQGKSLSSPLLPPPPAFVSCSSFSRFLLYLFPSLCLSVLSLCYFSPLLAKGRNVYVLPISHTRFPRTCTSLKVAEKSRDKVGWRRRESMSGKRRQSESGEKQVRKIFPHGLFACEREGRNNRRSWVLVSLWVHISLLFLCFSMLLSCYYMSHFFPFPSRLFSNFIPQFLFLSHSLFQISFLHPMETEQQLCRIRFSTSLCQPLTPFHLSGYICLYT